MSDRDTVTPPIASRVRPDFLVHWIGKDIHCRRPQAGDDDCRARGGQCACQIDHRVLSDQDRERYLSHLQGALAKGLWMTKPRESITGYKGVSLSFQPMVTCFTELKLSQTRSHTGRYGCLGLGFSRAFVIERLGCPVHYLSGTDDDAIVANLDAVRNVLIGLERSNIPAVSKGHPVQVRRVRDALEHTIAFLKRMWEATPGDYGYLEEMEWRIVQADRMECKGRLVPTGQDLPEVRIPFTHDELKLLILPDDVTRRRLYACEEMMKWFEDERGQLHLPVIATVEECLQF
jgi:hypothetical protein